jgi:uncharacterized repeat protein (TIGR01451 family)
MVWQRLIQQLHPHPRRPQTDTKTARRRRLGLETLTKRMLLASDIGAITGVAFTDATGDGLTGDDPRLESVTVELYADTNTNGSFDAGTDTLIATDTTDTSSDPVPGQYRFDDLSVGDYFVVQAAASGATTPPPPQLVSITADDADGDTIVTIDDFTSGTQLESATSGGTTTGSVAATNALGGSRDVQLVHTNASGNTTFQVDTGTELLSLSTGGGATAEATVEYDGNDSTFGLNVPPGFSPVSSLAGGTAGGAVPTNSGLEIIGRAENQPESMVVTVMTSATEASEISVTIPQDAALQTIFLEFSDPGWTNSSLAGVTGPADFNSIIAVRAQASVTLADNDIFFSVVESRGPSPVTTNLSNTQLMTLGGTVFNDDGGGTVSDLNNGTLDAGESGIQDVVVELYAEPGGGGSIDPSTQSPASTTTTDASGDYSFSGLAAGNYVVVIPESEFNSGEPLFGHISSTGNDPAPDPDDDVDGDDNGTFLAGVGVVTAEVTLAVGSEPTDDSDTDADTNFSIDMGVTPTIDLEITKTLDSAASSLEAGGTAIFDIDFTNNGPLDATGVVISDLIPSGLTIDQASSNFGAFTPTINGQDISVDVGALAIGATGSIRIVTNVDSGQTVDLTNTASISGDQVDTDATNNSDSAAVDLASSDLSITKSDNTADSVVAGEQFTYTFTVSNSGPDTAEGIVVTDNLPAELSYVSGSFSTGSGTITESPSGSGSLSISVDDLAAGASATFDIIVLVDADAGASIVNTATVAGTPDTDSDPSNNSATETTAVVRNVDVAVDKSTTGTATAGGQLTYTIEVTNSGPGDARDVTVTDTLTSELSFASFDAGTSATTVTQNGQDLTFDVGTLASGATETFSFTVDIASSATGTLSNTADVATSDIDTDATNDSDTVEVTAVIDTDLVIAKNVDLSTAVPGQDTLSYTFEISHDSDSISDSGEVTFTDALPAGLTGVTIDAPQATSSGFDSAQQTATIVFGSIPVGETRTFTITASVNEDATGTITNTGSFTVTGNESDTTNNSDTAETDLTPQFDVTLTKTADDTTPDPGADVTYTIELTNVGPSTATGVILTDDVPAGLSFVSGTIEGQSATLSGSTVTFPEITLDDEETVSATLVFTVGVDESGTLTNTASVTADDGETDTTNNTATAEITASPVSDLTVTKSVDQSAAQVGDTLTYTVTVSNSGPSTAVDATAVDTLPAGVTFVSGTGPSGGALTAPGGVITVDGGDVAASGSFTFTYDVTIDTDAASSISNSVNVSTTTAESNSGNNAASATTTVDPLTSSIAGSVYLDANDNGVRDAGEQGIENVTLQLSGTDSLGNPVSREVTTDANGDYVFAELAEGTYRIDEIQPPNFRDGQETLGTGASATINDDAFVDLDLDAATAAEGFNFGELNERLSKRRFLASS